MCPAFRIKQADSDVSLGKNEAYIMNRKKEKSVLSKEGNVYVLDLFVKVPSGATAPIKHTPMEVDAVQSSCRREESKGSELHLTAANQLFDVRRSERGRQVQANWNRKTTMW